MAQDSRRHLSVSQLSSYSRCPMAFKLQKFDKVPDPPAAWLTKGQAVHRILEDWELRGRPSAYDFNVAYEEEWTNELTRQKLQHPDLSTWVKTPRVKTTERDLELRKAEGLNEVITYINRAQAESDLWEVLRLTNGRLTLELPFTIDFGEFDVIGRIDVLQRWKADGSITVADYKSGSDRGEAYRQLGTYRVGLMETYGIDVTYGNYWYTKLDRSSGWIDLTRYTKDYLKDQYTQLDTAIANNIFIPAPEKDKCKLCGVRPYCPEMG